MSPSDLSTDATSTESPFHSSIGHIDNLADSHIKSRKNSLVLPNTDQALAKMKQYYLARYKSRIRADYSVIFLLIQVLQADSSILNHR